MKTILNIVWFFFAGLPLAIGYAVAGLLLAIPVITIPFSVAAFRLAGYSLWPFGRTVVPRPGAGAGSALGNLLWLLLAGWWLALEHLVTGVLLAITIVGIPMAVANFKMIPVALAPLGKAVVPTRNALAFA